MDQATMIRNGELWARMPQLIQRYSGLREHFQAFAEHAVTLTQEQGLGGIAVTPLATNNHFDVTVVGRTFRYRFAPRVVHAHGLFEGHIVVTEYDQIAKKEIGPRLADIIFNGHGRTPLFNPADNDPISVNTDIAARYLVLHVIYDALMPQAANAPAPAAVR